MTRTLRAGVLVGLVFVLLAAHAGAQSLPRPRGFVTDDANVISEAHRRTIEQIATAVREQTSAEIAVLTVRSMAPYGSIEQYGIAVAQAWGVGSSNDEGVLFVVAVDERQLRLEVGYGLEGAIPDGRAGALLDRYVVPDLRQNNYGAGLAKGVAAVAQIIAEEFGVTLAGVEAPQAQAASDGPDIGDLVYVIFLLLFVGGRWFFWPLLFVRGRRGFYGGGFGSSSGGRSSSSGFGGFSGGGFGGGGASRGF